MMCASHCARSAAAIHRTAQGRACTSHIALQLAAHSEGGAAHAALTGT
jgi:hypothetical protein